MIGIDHSLTGGAIRRLAKLCNPDAMSVVVFDSHLDAIPVSVISAAVQYDIETNPMSVHDRNDPHIYQRADSYNTSSFLHFLLSERIITPDNLYIFGINDYPSRAGFRIKDERIKQYVSIYSGLRKAGSHILTKTEIVRNPYRVAKLLTNIKTPYVYISIDMDVGFGNAVKGVRFRDYMGLGETEIVNLMSCFAKVLQHKKLVGVDVMEINPRIAGKLLMSGKDRTYYVAANIIQTILGRS